MRPVCSSSVIYLVRVVLIFECKINGFGSLNPILQNVTYINSLQFFVALSSVSTEFGPPYLAQLVADNKTCRLNILLT